MTIAGLTGCARVSFLSDAGGTSAPADAPAEPALTRCDEPIAAWTLQQRDYGGDWARLRAARWRGETMLVVVDDVGAHVLSFDPATSTPELVSSLLLESTAGATLHAVARDDARIVTAWTGAVRVHDAAGAALAASPTAFVDEPASADVELAGDRVGVAFAGHAGATGVEVHDVRGGLLARPTLPPGSGELGLGRWDDRLVLVARMDAESSLFVLGDDGLTPLRSLGTLWNGPTFGGRTLVGIVVEDVELLFDDGTAEGRGPFGFPYGGLGALDVADGPRGAIVTAVGDRRLAVSLPGGQWIALARVAEYGAHADAGAHRVGAFYLEAGALRWAGLSCSP